MSRRSDKVAEAIKREASILIKDALWDPRIGFVTVTRVKVSEDLRYAAIYYSVLGNKELKDTSEEGLESALKYLKKGIGDRVKLKYTPEIVLKLDDASEYKDKINNILDKIKKEKKD